MFKPTSSNPSPDPFEAWKSRALDWSQIDAPGCYLHLPSGLLARVFAREESPVARGTGPTGGIAVRLADDPHTPIQRLREIAERDTLPVAF